MSCIMVNSTVSNERNIFFVQFQLDAKNNNNITYNVDVHEHDKKWRNIVRSVPVISLHHNRLMYVSGCWYEHWWLYFLHSCWSLRRLLIDEVFASNIFRT